MNQQKKCSGINKAFGFNGCGKLTFYRKNGLCNNCYQSFLLNDDRGKSAKKKAPIKKVSDKRKNDNETYKKLRVEFLSEEKNKICFIDGCGKEANTIEHRAGRWGKNFLDTSTWAACCLHHNLELENNPELSKKYQLSKITGKHKL